MTETQALSGFVEIELSMLVENPHNYRKTSDEKKDADLAESIRSKGILQPLLVRPIAGKRGRFEVVFGSRRLRAARVAGVLFAPCQVREMTDVEALEAALVENVQRADVHPLEEADGFAELIKEHGYTIADLAAKVGKTDNWVRGRLKLAEMGKAGRKALLDGKISTTAASLISRSVPKDREAEVIKHCTDWHRDTQHVMPLDRLRDYLTRVVLCELSGAPWKLDDEQLDPEAGACAGCPKRTKNDAVLFADMAERDVCTDATCFKGKLEAHWKRVEAAAVEKGQRVLTPEESAKVVTKWGQVAGDKFALADQDTYSGSKRRSWKQVAKAADVQVVIARDAEGKPVELVPLTPEVKAEAGLNARGATSRSKSASEKAREARDKRERAAIDLACGEFADSTTAATGLSHLSDNARRAIASLAVSVAWDEYSRRTINRRGLAKLKNGHGSNRDVLREWCRTASAAECEGLLVEFVIRVGRGQPASWEWKALGVDMKRFERQVVANEKAAAREKAEAGKPVPAAKKAKDPKSGKSKRPALAKRKKASAK